MCLSGFRSNFNGVTKSINLSAQCPRSFFCSSLSCSNFDAGIFAFCTSPHNVKPNAFGGSKCDIFCLSVSSPPTCGQRRSFLGRDPLQCWLSLKPSPEFSECLELKQDENNPALFHTGWATRWLAVQVNGEFQYNVLQPEKLLTKLPQF